MTTSNDIANQAIMLIGDNQPKVSGTAPNFDSSPAGLALAEIYQPTVQTVMRQFGWDFSRASIPLTVTGNTAPFPYTYEYAWPANCAQLWQVMPQTLEDPFDPLPVEWVTGNTLVANVQSRVIWTNQQNAQAVYNSTPDEDTWDSLFTETVVRLLASKLATAIDGKAQTAEMMLQSGSSFEQLGESRRDV